MKHVRVVLALALCLVLACAGSIALAASDQFTEVPTLKITVPDSGITSRQLGYLTVDPSVPGFLTMTLADSAGSQVAAIATNLEVHSGENSIEFRAVDDENTGLAAGTYTLIAYLTSQFGVDSQLTNTPLTIVANPNDEEEDEEETAQTADGDEVEEEETTGASDSKDTDADAKAETSVKETVTSASGTFVMGDEGLQIGVGVTDVAEQTDPGYWGLTSDSTDEEIWAAMIREMPRVNVDETESAYIYDSTEQDRKKIGTVFGTSQGLNVIAEREDGWSLVEAFRNEDGAFVRGYIASNKITVASPNTDYGILIDKSTQTLTVFKDGERIGSCSVSTGLATPKYLQRETPAGEYITVTRRGTYEYYNQGYTKYTIRFSGNYYLCEIPSTKRNGSNFSLLEDSIGQKATRGSVCLPHDASSDGGINAEWIWNMTDESKRVKVLILDDKARSEVPVGEE